MKRVETFPELKKEKGCDYYSHQNSFIGCGLGVKLRATGSPATFLSYEEFMTNNPDLSDDNPQRRGYDEHYFSAAFSDLPNKDVVVVLMRGKRSGQFVLFEDLCNAGGSHSKNDVPTLDFVYKN